MDLVDLIFPKTCLGCGKEGFYICRSCVGKMHGIKTICPVCEKASVDGLTHIKCRKKLSLDGLIFFWPYEGVIRKAIIAFKYKYAKEIAKELMEYISEVIFKYKFALPKNAVLVPTPLYWYRENFRGFNQSDILGKAIAENQAWKYIPDLIIRKELKRSQTQLKSELRKKNIRGVFALNPKYYSLMPGAYHLILFDDVYTTGSTLKEACKVLKRRGAKEVWGLAIAH